MCVVNMMLLLKESIQHTEKHVDGEARRQHQ